MGRLFITGNGFDLAHGRKTSYEDFRQFLLRENYGLFIKSLECGRNIKKSGVWADIESCMGNVGKDKFLSTAFSCDLEGALKEWILEVESEKPEPLFKPFVRTSDLFITFNYTNTLEDIYGVDEDKILHLHGSYKNGDKLIMGQRTKTSSTEAVLDEYFHRTYKPVEMIIDKKLEPFLKVRLCKIDEILVLGHSIRSYGWVDRDYFQYLANWLKMKENIKWSISFLHNDEISEKERVFCGFGISPQQLRFGHIEQLIVPL